jgi:drug/metabolite transporter (DMT)-like permease
MKSREAATIQLSVPVIAAIGGILLLDEVITLRLVVASLAILGGIALVVLKQGAAGARAANPVKTS